MASSTMTILSLYKYMKRNDDDLFDDLVVPEGVDTEVLINNILMQAAPFEVLYPDPEVMKDAIGFWSEASLDKWQKWADAWEYASEFNPLENFDRTETEEIAHSGTDTTGNTQTRNLAGSDTRTANLQEQATKNLQDLNTKNLSQLETRNLTDAETKSLTDEHKVSAFDSSTYAPKDQDTHTGTDNITHTGTDTVANTGTDKVERTGTDTLATTGTDKHDTTDTGTVADQGATVYGHEISRNARYHGNIGVTSLAQLLTSYDEAAENWDLYAVITADFIKRFCIMVY